MKLWIAAAGLVVAPLAPAQSVAPSPRSIEVTAPGPLGPLHGTLLLPSGRPAATMLIIPGSGPTDRDGNNPAGVAGGPYRQLAEGLALRGIATVRIDKRGMFASKAAVADGNRVRIADYAADTSAWVAAARKATGARCVWIGGHSEGGLVALAAARTPRVCGLVLIATLGRPMNQVIRDQLTSNPANAPVLAPALAAIGELEAGRHVDVTKLHPALHPLFAPAVQDYLIDTFRIDPARLIAGYRGRVLILQGDRDIQVGVADARRLAAADAGAKLVIIHGANHVLRPVGSDDRTANFNTYKDAKLAIVPDFAEAIVAFARSKK